MDLIDKQSIVSTYIFYALSFLLNLFLYFFFMFRWNILPILHIFRRQYFVQQSCRCQYSHTTTQFNSTLIQIWLLQVKDIILSSPQQPKVNQFFYGKCRQTANSYLRIFKSSNYFSEMSVHKYCPVDGVKNMSLQKSQPPFQKRPSSGWMSVDPCIRLVQK